MPPLTQSTGALPRRDEFERHDQPIARAGEVQFADFIRRRLDPAAEQDDRIARRQFFGFTPAYGRSARRAAGRKSWSRR